MLITEFHKLYAKKGLTSEINNSFQKIIYSYFKQNRRDFPFRKDITPYKVLISEIMLQQTQTGRVSEKFLKFIGQFPDFQTLSKAPLQKVLKAWQGLGYNRRAKALKEIAEKIIDEYSGKLPKSVQILKTFPQIGHNTASSISTFAFNKPNIFIETNIRRVFIYFFFPTKTRVKDSEILPIIERTIDKNNPREWYYALMDYGFMLSKKHPELNKKSAHYRKQSPFKGSKREIRGLILKLLIENRALAKSEIIKILDYPTERIQEVISQLKKEGFIRHRNNLLTIAK